MILFLRACLVSLALLFTYFFGETMEQFLLQVIRIFIAVEPSNAVTFNLIHAAILLFPLVLFGVLISIATIDDSRLRNRSQTVVGGMLLGLLAYRLFQVWWILKWGAFADDPTIRTEAFSQGQIVFLEQFAPWMILGISSALLPAIIEESSDSVFYAALSSLCLFLWLIIAKKLPPANTYTQSLAALFMTVSTGFATGTVVKKIKES